jgi:hypothetical protein
MRRYVCRFRGLEVDPHLANFRAAGPGGSVDWALRSLQGQRNFTDEPLIAPIKTHLTAELVANYFSQNARAEPAVRRRRDSRPA